jgi:ABC-2 type transport system permease protein
VTTALIQGLFILGVSSLMGFRIKSILSLGMTFVLMMLISVAFLGLGLIFASKMKDMQGFSMVMNFVIFPLLFLSGAFYPLENFPSWLRYISYLDPLTYGVDGLRGVLVGISSHSILFNFVIMVGFAMVMIFLGAYFFEKSESV